MKIESDAVEFLAGLRGSVTLGSPLAVDPPLTKVAHSSVRVL